MQILSFPLDFLSTTIPDTQSDGSSIDVMKLQLPSVSPALFVLHPVMPINGSLRGGTFVGSLELSTFYFTSNFSQTVSKNTLELAYHLAF